METPELAAPGYWESEEPDIRFNPAGVTNRHGLEALIKNESRLRGHVLLATSAGRNAPKWIAVSKQAILASASAVNAHLESGPGDHWLLALPDFHVGGMGVFARAQLAGSSVSVFPGRWRDRSADFVGNCRSAGITLTALTPTQVFDLVRERHRAPESLRAVIVGGGGLDRETGRMARDLGWPVLQSYGMTEACSQVATESLDSLADPFSGSWLPVLRHWEVRKGDSGCLQIRGQALFSGMVVPGLEGDGWQFLPVALSADGFYETSDRVSLEAVSRSTWRLRFEGRNDDFVKVLGELVSLASLGRRWKAILSAEGGFAGAVVGLPDQRKGHRLIGVIEGTERASLSSRFLDRFNREVLPFERLDDVVWISELPRTSIGKVAVGRLVSAITGV